jgi:6-phosphogluconolactonase
MTMTDISQARTEIVSDPRALALRGAQWLLDVVAQKEGLISIALSGGSTPKLLYEHLAAPEYQHIFPWPRMHWFWGDERFVPPGDPESNYRMACEALLALAPIPPENIHAMPTVDMSPEEAATTYERTLKAFYGAESLDPERPLFDVTLLGIGEDGHTASLFPNTPALEERRRWVVATALNGLPRLTMTYPVLESSRHAAFLVSGKSKAAILARLRHGEQTLPAARFHPTGALWLFCDQAAAE